MRGSPGAGRAGHEEALRDLRSGMAKDLSHARQHVNAILLRHRVRYAENQMNEGTQPVAAPPAFCRTRRCSSPTSPMSSS